MLRTADARRAGRSLGRTRRSRARLLADRLSVTTDVSVLAADDEHDRLALADVLHLAVRRGVDARDAARAKDVGAAITEAKLDRARVHEVGLLLLVMEM